jgi:hypothetical protein
LFYELSMQLRCITHDAPKVHHRTRLRVRPFRRLSSLSRRVIENCGGRELRSRMLPLVAYEQPLVLCATFGSIRATAKLVNEIIPYVSALSRTLLPGAIPLMFLLLAEEKHPRDTCKQG